MFHWLIDRRRRKLTEAPFPEAWEAIVRRNVAHYCMLTDEERAHLRSLVQIFIAEKNWEGLGGLELTDDITVTVSAQACLLLLGLPHDFYRNVLSIFIYPSTVVPPQRKLGHFENTMVPVEASHPILGQAFNVGPVILVWDAVLGGGRHPEGGHNVVYHEFAHKLDMLDGAADGTPALRDRAEYRDWVITCSREYLRLKSEAQKGVKLSWMPMAQRTKPSFFAVATGAVFPRQPVRQ